MIKVNDEYYIKVDETSPYPYGVCRVINGKLDEPVWADDLSTALSGIIQDKGVRKLADGNKTLSQALCELRTIYSEFANQINDAVRGVEVKIRN